MNVKRGDIVLVDYPYISGGLTKVRPVVVIQNDRDNHRLKNTIVAQITSTIQRCLEPTQLLIEITTDEGQQSGLRQDSVVNTLSLLTIDQAEILRKLGKLSDSIMQKVDDCLKAALDLS